MYQFFAHRSSRAAFCTGHPRSPQRSLRKPSLRKPNLRSWVCVLAAAAGSLCPAPVLAAPAPTAPDRGGYDAASAKAIFHKRCTGCWSYSTRASLCMHWIELVAAG